MDASCGSSNICISKLPFSPHCIPTPVMYFSFHLFIYLSLVSREKIYGLVSCPVCLRFRFIYMCDSHYIVFVNFFIVIKQNLLYNSSTNHIDTPFKRWWKNNFLKSGIKCQASDGFWKPPEPANLFQVIIRNRSQETHVLITFPCSIFISIHRGAAYVTKLWKYSRKFYWRKLHPTA